MQVVWGRRADRSTQREAAARRLQLCEEQLQTLRQEFLEADGNLKDVETDVAILRNLFLQTNEIHTTNDEALLYVSDVDDNSTHSSNSV